ncbi:unnamed protein product [Amoebophrya sp. A25]|nr:unnamed protein product [Amoebophrya sp. A25]|eukprot:GSA25T00024347001.1
MPVSTTHAGHQKREAHRRASGETSIVEDSENMLVLRRSPRDISDASPFAAPTRKDEESIKLEKGKLHTLFGDKDFCQRFVQAVAGVAETSRASDRDFTKCVLVRSQIEEREVAQEDGQFGPTWAWPLGKLNIDLSGVEFVLDFCNIVAAAQSPFTQEHYVQRSFF